MEAVLEGRSCPRGLPNGSPTRPAVAVQAMLSRKAKLRRVAVREYARLRRHARNCSDCRPGASAADPPRINRACRLGVVGMAVYRRAYQAWVDCPEREGGR